MCVSLSSGYLYILSKMSHHNSHLNVPMEDHIITKAKAGVIVNFRTQRVDNVSLHFRSLGGGFKLKVGAV